jgi:hypothetical protein
MASLLAPAYGVHPVFRDGPVVSLVPRSTTGYNLGSLRLPRDFNCIVTDQDDSRGYVDFESL